jgi:hypothetical protein
MSGTVHPDTVKWGPKEAKLVGGTRLSGNGFSVAWYKKRIKRTKTEDVVATFPSAVTAVIIGAVMVDEAGAKDVNQKRTEPSPTGAPGTGSAVTSTVADTISLAAFVSKGPSGDTPGAAGAGHTLRQRAGTAGAPPASNLTMQITSEILTATGNIRAALSGATSRDWNSSIVAASASRTYTVKDAYRNRWVADTDADQVIIIVEGVTGERFQVRVGSELFSSMTDTEIADHIKAGCVWHADHHIESDNSLPVISSTQQTKMDNLVNDTFIL